MTQIRSAMRGGGIELELCRGARSKWKPGERRMPAMKYLRFYLARGCVVVPCQSGTKKLIRGAGEWTAEDSQANREKLTRNAAMRNGTGGLLVVDIDAKNGGSLDLMAERFPGSTMTRTIQTVSPGKHGFGLQLIYVLPDGFKISPTALVRDGEGRPMIEVASFSMLPGSRAKGADGVMRTYEVVQDVAPSPATPELLATVEARRVASEVQPVDAVENPTVARARLDMLLDRMSAAGDGQRNYAFTENALPVVRLCAVLGEDPEIVLTMAYDQSGGNDDRWGQAAIRSAIRRAAEEPTGRLELGPIAQRRLIEMNTWARFAPWPGPSGPSDRRVFLAVVGACLEQSRTDTALGSRKLAIRAGLTKETVEASLKRLEEAGRLHAEIVGKKVALLPGLKRVHVVNAAVRRPLVLPDDNTHILPPLVRVITSIKNVCGGIDPLHVVWSVPSTEKGAGLNGRHGHLFDLVCAGLTTARALGDYIGSRPDSLNRTLKRLADVGLLVNSGRTYIPADNVAALADRLALELGGAEACAHRENQYREEARQWRETQEQWEKEQESWKQRGQSWGESDGSKNQPRAPIAHDYLGDPFEPEKYRRDPFEPEKYLVEDPFERGKYLLVEGSFEPANLAHHQEEKSQTEDKRDRRWYEEQLLLGQLGLPNELEP